MKVALPSLAHEFESPSGGGMRRYMFELYHRLTHTGCVEKKELPFYRRLGGHVSFLLGSMLSDFSKYDIIHHLDNRVFLPMKKSKATFVTTVHDLAILTRPDLHQDFRENRFRKVYAELQSMRLSNLMALKSDFIIVQSTQTRKEVLSYGYPKENLFMTPLGIDERFAGEVEHSDHRIFTIGCVGTFCQKKNIRSAIEAFKMIASDKMILELWGNLGPLSGSLGDLIRENIRVRLMGPFSDDHLIDVYGRFDVFVLPSLHEGFGLPILEAYAREIPVIVYGHAQIPEEVSEYAIKVKDKEQMAHTIQEMAQGGVNLSNLRQARKYALSFSWDRTAKLTYEAYEKIMAP
jgi:glycosyltransferase involved in cell wall biosynthesis